MMFWKRSKKKTGIFIGKFLSLNLSTQIVISIIVGAGLGLLLRFYPEFFATIRIDANIFQALGTMFIKLIKMIALPLIFTCVMSSVISLCKQSSTGKTTVLTFISFAFMTVACIAVGAAFAIFFQPGAEANFDTTTMMEQHSASDDLLKKSQHGNMTVTSFLFNIVPSNIAVSFVECNFLQIIFFAILISLAIAKVDKKGSMEKNIKAVANVCMEAVHIVMKFAPLGIFGISTWLIATQDSVLLKALGKLICVDWMAAAFLVYVLYSLVFIFVLKLNPIHMWKKLFPAQFMAFLTASSSAALPTGMQIAKDKLGVSEEKTNFVAPFSAAINSSGGAMYFAMMTIFMAQLLNIELTSSQYTTLFIMCALCDLGVAPVPSGSLIMLGNVFIAVGIPIEALGIAFAVDRILDMARTFVNFTGDIFAAVIVDRFCKTMDVKMYAARFKIFGLKIK